jgi:hypothetical protein
MDDDKSPACEIADCKPWVIGLLRKKVHQKCGLPCIAQSVEFSDTPITAKLTMQNYLLSVGITTVYQSNVLSANVLRQK